MSKAKVLVLVEGAKTDVKLMKTKFMYYVHVSFMF